MSALNEQLPEFSPYVFRNHTMCSLPVFTSSYSSSQFFQLPGAAETGDRATAGESSHRPESQAFGQAICFSSVYIYILNHTYISVLHFVRTHMSSACRFFSKLYSEYIYIYIIAKKKLPLILHILQCLVCCTGERRKKPRKSSNALLSCRN